MYLSINDSFFFDLLLEYCLIANIDSKNYEITIKDNNKSINLSLEDLKKKYKIHDVITTIQCAGNRRKEFEEVDERSSQDTGMDS